MRVPRRRRLALLAVTAAVTAIVAAPAQSAGLLADGPCPPGTNWDNRIQACR